MNNQKIALIGLAIVLTGCCTVSLLSIALGGLWFYRADVASAGLSPVEQQANEAEVLNVAATYAQTKDISSAREQLHAMHVANPDQYIVFLLDRYLQENRSKNEPEIQNLYVLAEGLGATTPAMVAMLASPTPTTAATNTPAPTATLAPTNTSTPIQLPTDTPIPAETATPTETATSEATATPVATDTPVPVDTATPAPPTNTPEPTATPEPPKPAFDFVVAHQKMVRNPDYGMCPGNHQIFVMVVDVNGNPLDGVTVEDTDHAVPPHLSGEKGPGKLEYDMYKNGYSLHVIKDVGGGPATSQISDKLSTWDEDIPNEWLVEANYCLDLDDCLRRKSSNSLCRGHYTYELTLQKTH
jgi:hypothetical protein